MAGPQFRIVRLTDDTRSSLDRIADGVFDGPVRADYLGAFLSDPSHHMVLAIVGNEVVGMASAVIYLHPDKPANMWVNEVGVGDNFRRQGIGRALVSAVVELAQDLGCSEAWLGTEADNAPALALYRSFANVSEEQGSYFTWETNSD